MFDAERHPAGLIPPGGKEIDKLISLYGLCMCVNLHMSVVVNLSKRSLFRSLCWRYPRHHDAFEGRKLLPLKRVCVNGVNVSMFVEGRDPALLGILTLYDISIASLTFQLILQCREKKRKKALLIFLDHPTWSVWLLPEYLPWVQVCTCATEQMCVYSPKACIYASKWSCLFHL